MRHVDLCSGIGGFALGFEWAGLSKPVLFCDIEPWSRKILRKHWPDVPIAEDVKELANDPDGLIPDCDILTAGYPCQPFSVSGARRGFQDDRHIWPQILSIIQAKRPSWCVFENVSGHISLGLNEVLSDLESKANYAVQTFHLGAVSVDAPHRRMRLWIVARNVGDTKRSRQQRNDRWQSKQEPKNGCADVAHAHSARQQQGHEEVARQSPKQFDSGSIQSRKDVAHAERIECKGSGSRSVLWEREVQAQPGRGSQDAQVRWPAEPNVCRVSHGVPNRVDRLRGLGNAIVPQIAQRIGQVIKQCEADT